MFLNIANYINSKVYTNLKVYIEKKCCLICIVSENKCYEFKNWVVFHDSSILQNEGNCIIGKL